MSNKENIMQKNWQEYRSYYILLIACIFLLFCKVHVISLLDIVVLWLKPCSKDWFAVLISIIGITLSIYQIFILRKRSQYVANSTFATVLFIAIVYSYFRFIDKTYCFWGIGYYKWGDILYLPFILLIIQKSICGKTKQNSDSEGNEKDCLHITDKPIDDPKNDRLGYDWMSNNLLMDLANIEISNHSFSIGILGKWGQGKSSFMNLFKYHAKEEGSIIVEFYPRASKSINSIQEDFFISLKESLKIYNTGVERHITNYSRMVAEVDKSWIGKVALFINRMTVTKEKKQINDVIESIGRRVYVIVEDFDRLTGEEILEVLKLLDRNGDFCNTVFVTAYDKSYVNEVIQKYLNHTVSVDYTDKYFDYEYPLPANSPDVLSSFAISYIQDRIKIQKGDKIDKQQLLDAWAEKGKIIVRYLDTMRNVKRYINMFMSRYPKVKNDVDVTDFMLLTLLRYKDMAAYNAIFDFRIIRRGSSYTDDSTKMIYLQDDYADTLKKLGISDSSKFIIEQLFHKPDEMKGALIKNEYDKLKWVSSFNSYFSDFRIGKYHYEDFLQLFTEEEEKAFSLIDMMQKDGITAQLTDFLISRKENWIKDEIGLARLVKIIIYLDSLDRIVDLDFLIDGFMTSTSMDEYVKAGVVKDKEMYKATIKNTIVEIINRCPMEVGFSCQRILEEIYREKTIGFSLIFSTEELVGWSLWAQRYYYQRYETDNYDINVILNLAKVKEKKGDIIDVVKPAKMELAALMKKYPEQFAKDIVIPYIYSAESGRKDLVLRINKYLENNMLSLDDFSFEKWIDSLQNDHISYVIKCVYETGWDKSLRVPAIKNKYEPGDFDGFYEAVRAYESKEDDKTIMGIIDGSNARDYKRISELANISINRVKESIKRLVNKKNIDAKYAKLKDVMEPFEKGDYVKMIDTAFLKHGKDLFYKDNIFKIENIDDGYLKLEDYDPRISMDVIEAIPIDGKHDRNFYYEPFVAAPFVGLGKAVPMIDSNPNEYYMDGLANTAVDNKNVKEIVEERNCQYVHEVQHCLRELFNTDDIEVNRTITGG